MGRRKNSGFNAPFGQLKRQAPTTGASVAMPKQAAKPTPPTRVESDEEIFLRAMRGTAPLVNDADRVPPPVGDPPVRLSDDALALQELHELVEGKGSFRVHESEEVLYGLAPGVNMHLLEQLQQG